MFNQQGNGATPDAGLPAQPGWHAGSHVTDEIQAGAMDAGRKGIEHYFQFASGIKNRTTASRGGGIHAVHRRGHEAFRTSRPGSDRDESETGPRAGSEAA
jgi:hypothetical protein